MKKQFELYEKVKIIATDETGIVVAIDTDGGTKPPIYFVEKDGEFKTWTSKDLAWYEGYQLKR